jgi:hypothetical protein
MGLKNNIVMPARIGSGIVPGAIPAETQLANFLKSYLLPPNPANIPQLTTGYRPVKPAGKTAMNSGVSSAEQVSKALYDNNFPVSVMPYVMDQAAFETAGFSSPAFIKDNNASGISPSRYAPKGITEWAHYDTLDDWAADMKRVLQLSPNYPIRAISLADYVHRLKGNNYFDKMSEADYLRGLQAESTKWKNIMSLYTDTHTNLVMPGQSFLKEHPLIAGMALMVGGILVFRALLD